MMRRTRHLLGIEDLSDEAIHTLLERTEQCSLSTRKSSTRGAARNICHLFFENSTRTRVSFEMAAHRLGYKVFDASPSRSSINKGETLLDTARTLRAIGAEAFVIRHKDPGTPHFLAQEMDIPIINAGDGAHEHPTQALLDAATVYRNKGRIKDLVITYCGDVLHSRVASSGIRLLHRLGAQVRIWSPASLTHHLYAKEGIAIFDTPEEALSQADIVMVLRLQNERMTSGIIPSIEEYQTFYRLTTDHLSLMKEDGLIFHPGPQNRGIEITSEVLDDSRRARVEQQVSIGVTVRQVVLQWIFES